MESIIISILSAALYSLIFYFKKSKRKGNLENFNPFKLAATLLVGAGVGVAFHITGIPIAEETIEVQIASYTGTIALVESSLKAAVRSIKQFRDK